MKAITELSGSGRYVVDLSGHEVSALIRALEHMQDEGRMTFGLHKLKGELSALLYLDEMIDRAANRRVADLLAEQFGVNE